MVELDEATRRALLAREGPPPSARAEVLAGLRAKLGGPTGPDDPDDPDDSGDPGDLDGGESMPFEGSSLAGGQIAWAAKVVGATLGLTGAALLTIKLVATAASSNPTEPAPAQPVIEAPELAAVIEPHETPREALAAPPDPSLPEHELAPRVAARATKPAESTLAAELALIRAAKRSRDDDCLSALAQLELHDRRFPTGSLAPEREALRVELLCTLGRHAAATAARTKFVEQHGDSPLRARVLASCAGR